MPNNQNQDLRNIRELTSHLEENDLWDLDDDWAEESDDAPTAEESTTPEHVIPPAPVVKDEQPSRSSIEVTDSLDPENDTFESENILDHEIGEENTPASSIQTDAEDDTLPVETSPDTAHPAELPHPTINDPATPDDAIIDSDSESESTPTNNLNTIEKIALTIVAVSLLGLAIYSYVWLHGQNLTKDDTALQLPVKGEYATISKFSTYWTTASNITDIKIGAQVLPAATITLDPESTTSGVLRIYFRNVENLRIGDPITMPFKGGKFTTSTKSNISIEDDGSSVRITSSDGFHQEGDFSAYVLDEKLAWKVFVLEAKKATASGKDFKEIINTKVDAQRR